MSDKNTITKAQLDKLHQMSDELEKLHQKYVKLGTEISEACNRLKVQLGASVSDVPSLLAAVNQKTGEFYRNHEKE